MRQTNNNDTTFAVYLSGDEIGVDMLVTIITVCYNSEKTIAQTIESVLHQTYSDIEYLIIDGKSSDNTMKIVENYRMAFGARMRVVSEPDNGIYDAMNKGIRMASGDLIGIINSDDFYEQDAVEKIVRSYRKDMCAVLYGAVRNLVDDREESVSILSHEFLDRRMIGHPACFITKSAYDRYGLYDTKYCSVADYDLMLRYRNSGGVEFVPVYEIIANFRSGGMCSSQRAYFDLLNLQRDYSMIGKRQCRVAKMKAKLSGLLHFPKR
ncbi:MAG: glycosyltransferase [Lachnospiraceae bacterium]|nr:glycosyltransferase [Lachnospiraceae bacterium]MBD5483061.1 glycosyltransferase [Lachnospiraceae bacterium]